MPLLGLGYEYSFFLINNSTYCAVNEEECFNAVKTAIKAGYRSIDTAVAYGNQKIVGKAIKSCIDEGIITRSDIFVTTKLWLTDWKPEDVERSVKLCLEELQLEYIDLFLIHQSVFINLAPEDDKKRREGYFFDYQLAPADDPTLRLGYNLENLKLTWGKMEELCGKGLLRSIGVSNFSAKRIRDLVSVCKIKPAVNQIELHPYLQQWETKATCEEFGIYLMAYYPLGGAVSTRSTKAASPMDDPVIIKIAKAHNKTPAQVMIRWAVQRGTICIPKSVHENRIIENGQIYDFILGDKEMSEIRSLDKGYRFARRSFLLPSPMDWKDLWDGEYVSD